MNQKQYLSSKKSNSKLFVVVGIVVIAIFVLSLTLGRYSIPAGEAIRLFIQGLFRPGSLDFNDPTVSVFFYIRLPRIVVALLVGAALAVAGAIFQGMFRNPLVSPDILGVSSGCSFGAALGILMPFATIYSISISSFVFGTLAMGAAYAISKASKGEPIIMLILAGMVVSAFFTAALSFLQYVADPYNELPAIIFWIMGGFFRITWDIAIILAITIIPCLIIAWLLAWKLDLLSLGDDEAQSLGLNVKLLRFVLIIVATFMVAASVSAAGTIAWVGLVIPHIARMLTSSEHTMSVPMSMFVGGGFVLLMDTVARNLTTAEIPISILTAALGAPFFAYLLISRSHKAWNR
ncbi:FecCD family ABC transporter permease [Desulfuribacillus alkaliarsenatis]|uniref:Iron ABC transporter permease n=1 Tax=Desulfuribacillus alkaliarsenatis TaxID=766136 RepID=A0A1E5FZA3_9FIRM|nr:iron ABC transporter permease [Desulfuribacillus alkaliarsenatis]OEF95903.1 iron ABC transporter permease [Desulfuribacillus alkaliarsenatis]